MGLSICAIQNFRELSRMKRLNLDSLTLLKLFERMKPEVTVFRPNKRRSNSLRGFMVILVNLY